MMGLLIINVFWILSPYEICGLHIFFSHSVNCLCHSCFFFCTDVIALKKKIIKLIGKKKCHLFSFKLLPPSKRL